MPEAETPLQHAFRPTPTPGKPKAESLTAPDITIEDKAAGSRMRGQAEFGWDDAKDGNNAHKTHGHNGTAS